MTRNEIDQLPYGSEEYLRARYDYLDQLNFDGDLTLWALELVRDKFFDLQSSTGSAGGQAVEQMILNELTQRAMAEARAEQERERRRAARIAAGEDDGLPF